MKRHVGHITIGGFLVPLILGIAAAAGQGVQSGLGLGLNGIALAIFLVGFMAGASLVLHGSMKVEAAKLANDVDLGKMLGEAAKALGGLGGGEGPSGTGSPSPFGPLTPPPTLDPPPPPSP